MIQVLYTVLYCVGFVLMLPVFLYKMWKRGKYRENFWQRFGVYRPELRQRLSEGSGPRCWIQAVSVGEVNVALAFIRVLQPALPGLRIILTTTTSTGYALAREALRRVCPAAELLYFPQDFPGCVRRAYALIRPDFVVLMESELWPNHLAQGARCGVPIFLVNARLSPRSARRYRWWPWWSRRLFGQLTLIAAQSQEDADHFLALGAPCDRVHLTGNLKYDASLPQADGPRLDAAALLRRLGVTPDQPVVVAGSTHPGEEEVLMELCAGLRPRFPGLFLVLVPRHVERAPEVVELARRKAVKLVCRRALDSDAAAMAGGAAVDCLLVDTTGELKAFYQVATVIFVGKSLVGRGGQNIVEAAASGHPVVFGPHMQNFKAIARQFVNAGAGLQVADAARLRDAIETLLAQPDRRAEIAAAARRVIAANTGATQRCVALLVGSLTAADRPARKNF